MIKPRATDDQLAFLAGGGEMGERIRAFDWSKTSLGPPESWPQSLRSAVRTLLASKAQIILFWGPQFLTLYNDAYRPVFGGKHPGVLGLPGHESWRELWQVGLKDLLGGVVQTGEAYWASDRLFVVERFGYREETYFDVSYDPVLDDTGRVGGVFCIVSETTARVIGPRRLRTLRELSARTTEEARSAEDACQAAVAILGANRHDVPFSLIYLLAPDGTRARLAGAAGLPEGSPAAPREIDLAAPAAATFTWPLRAVLEGGKTEVVAGVDSSLGALTGGVWPEPPHTALVLPIAQSRQDRPAGFLVAGASPRRPLDEHYHGFFDLVATQVATALANARAYEQEKKRAEALAELDRAKTAFFSNVSHEFRTPLTLMLGPIEDLLSHGTELSAAARTQLEVVHRNGLRLLRLVNTLLDFSRIEAGRVGAAYQATDLAALTAELASVFRAAVERAGLRLIVDCPALAEPVFVDRDMWEKIVLNLLSNAFKFTFAGQIEVRLREGACGAPLDEAAGPLRRCATLTVRDTGTGIPAAEMPRLFERFHRIQSAQARTHEGSGIGLALVQELVKLHGGSIVAASTPGQGTTFTVEIPLGSAHLPSAQVGDSAALPSTGTGAASYVEEALRWLPGHDRGADQLGAELPGANETVAGAPVPAQAQGDNRPSVLVADDNADMRGYILRLLAARYQINAVADGDAALAAARERLPDLILTDVMMPRLDGFGLLRELRADPRTRDVPVIMLSARAGEESRVEGMEAGADDYLIKPFSARELLARVGAHVQMARLRREAAEALRADDRRKDEFLATLSHELRNPLAPVKNSLEVLRRSKGNAELIEQCCALIDRQVSQMVRLVDDLLDLSRIKRNKLDLRREKVDLAATIQRAVEACRPLVDRAEHELDVAVPAEPIFLQADSARLVQVFSNLLSNACKFTERRGRIRLSVEPRDAHVQVRIKDNGIGIPASMLSSVFEMFTQVDRGREHSRGGLGIGLALVKRLVELHDGAVTAHSDGQGKGSEFTVRLPLHAENQEPRVREPDGEPVRTKARRILVVDDNKDAAASLAMLFTIAGEQAQTVHDGMEAVQRAATFRPDIILLDLGLPRLSGYDACRAIREQSWGKQIVIVALTGWGQEEDRRRSKEAGFDGHLVKPVDYAALTNLLAELAPAEG
jgi:signal transduction histidine kinase